LQNGVQEAVHARLRKLYFSFPALCHQHRPDTLIRPGRYQEQKPRSTLS
jgi:hypothetical protein